MKHLHSTKTFTTPSTHSWQPRFTFTNGQISTALPLSSAFYKYPSPSTDKTDPPDILYSIPQSIWDEFIQCLNSQETVTTLDLSTHRHLISSYNFINPPSGFRKNVATMIGKYHFLSDPACYSHLDKTTDIYSFLPEASRSFYRLVQHCPRIEDVSCIRDLLVGRVREFDSTKQKEVINKTKLEDMLNALPSSKNSPSDRALHFDPNSIHGKLVKDFFTLYTDKTIIHKMYELELRWHRNIKVIENSKPVKSFDHKWHALFENQQISNVSFECLTSEQELKTEGLEMEHCVGGYTEECLSGETHIIRAKTNNGARATLELEKDDTEENQFKIVQNNSEENSFPDSDITNASEILLSRLNSGAIKINEGKSEELNVSISEAHKYYSYNFDDLEVQEKIYQAYTKHKVLPPFMVAENYAEFLKKPAIKALLDETIRRYVTPIQGIEDQQTISVRP